MSADLFRRKLLHLEACVNILGNVERRKFTRMNFQNMSRRNRRHLYALGYPLRAN